MNVGALHLLHINLNLCINLTNDDGPSGVGVEGVGRGLKRAQEQGCPKGAALVPPPTALHDIVVVVFNPSAHPYQFPIRVTWLGQIPTPAHNNNIFAHGD
jgi:hypothetical protein